MTVAAPSPDPLRMYAAIAERIAGTALAGPRVPELFEHRSGAVPHAPR
ncbi:hypothetical protein [Streptosporangium roseum]|nr:hypothetical protein [Streptosporangium roseum]